MHKMEGMLPNGFVNKYTQMEVALATQSEVRKSISLFSMK